MKGSTPLPAPGGHNSAWLVKPNKNNASPVKVILVRSMNGGDLFGVKSGIIVECCWKLKVNARD